MHTGNCPMTWLAGESQVSIADMSNAGTIGKPITWGAAWGVFGGVVLVGSMAECCVDDVVVVLDNSSNRVTSVILSPAVPSAVWCFSGTSAILKLWRCDILFLGVGRKSSRRHLWSLFLWEIESVHTLTSWLLCLSYFPMFILLYLRYVSWSTNICP